MILHPAMTLLYVDYKYLEDQEFLTVRDKVKESLFGGSVGDEWERAKLADFMETLVTLAAVTGNVVLYAYHLCKLSYWMLAIFLIAPFIMVLTQKTVMKNERDNAVKASGVWQKLDYVIRKTEDFSMAKDVRMYQMDVWLSGLLEKLCKKRLEYKAKELKPRCALSVISTLVFIPCWLVCCYTGRLVEWQYKCCRCSILCRHGTSIIFSYGGGFLK